MCVSFQKVDLAQSEEEAVMRVICIQDRLPSEEVNSLAWEGGDHSKGFFRDFCIE